MTRFLALLEALSGMKRYWTLRTLYMIRTLASDELSGSG